MPTIILLSILALAYLAVLIASATLKRWISFGAILALPVVLAGAGIVAVRMPKEILRHEFPNGSILVLRYTKPYGLLQSVAGIGNLEYTINTESFSHSGQLIRSLDLRIDTKPKVVQSDTDYVVVKDELNDKAWRFSDKGQMENQDFQQAGPGYPPQGVGSPDP